MNCPKCQKFVRVNTVDSEDNDKKFTCTNCWHVWFKKKMPLGKKHPRCGTCGRKPNG